MHTGRYAHCIPEGTYLVHQLARSPKLEACPRHGMRCSCTQYPHCSLVQKPCLRRSGENRNLARNVLSFVDYSSIQIRAKAKYIAEKNIYKTYSLVVPHMAYCSALRPPSSAQSRKMPPADWLLPRLGS